MAARHILTSEITNKAALNSVVHDKRRVLVRSGSKTVGAFVTTEELKKLKEIERREDEKEIKKYKKILEEIDSGKSTTISLEDIKKKHGIK